MRNRNLSYSIVIFVIAQMTWFSLLGLFVYRFITSRDMTGQMEEKLSTLPSSAGNSIIILVGGCFLYVSVSVAMSLIFKNLSSQLRLTNTYDNFIANVTHELKSPLASIHLYLETLQKRDVPKGQRQLFLKMMIEDANRLNNLINSILKISGIEQRKDIYECQIYQTDLLVKTLVEESMEQFKLTEANLKIEGEAPFQCVIDRNALKIAFDNLLDNAIKYSIPPIFITVQLTSTDKNIVIYLSDTGIGIPSQYQKKIFHKFYRISDSKSPNVKGTGLGLYWVKEIIKYHGGNISVVNNENTGSTFKIELPIYQISKTRYLNSLLKWAQRKKNARNK